MAINNDIEIRWDLSPRLIVVDASTTEITIQDLIDTLRTEEASIGGIDEPYILESSGKEDLGGGVTVGLTASIQNAQIYFEERSAPHITGTCRAINADGIYLSDGSINFTSENVVRGCIVYNASTGSMGTVLEVLTDNSIYSLPITGGSNTEWAIGDGYKIYLNELCSVTGGNIVAADASEDSIYPILQSPNVQSSITSSSSATLSDLSAIQYSSYQNAVWFDNGTTNSGTEYPVGTREYPVNNVTDAVNIANLKGFDTLQILTDISIDSGTDFSGFELNGISHVDTYIQILDDANVKGTRISNCILSGILDGGIEINECVINDLSFFNGHIHNSGLNGTIILDGSIDALIVSSHFSNLGDHPVIDMGGGGQDLIMTDWSGTVEIKNLDSSVNRCNIQMDGGKVILSSDITAGCFNINGVGLLENNAISYTLLNTEGLMSKDTISEAIWDAPLTVDDHNIEFSAGRLLRASASLVIRNGIAVDSGNGYNQITLDPSAQSYSGAYDPTMISIIDGTGDGQTRLILQYDGSARLATVDRDWKVQPDGTSEYILVGHPGRETVNEGLIQDASYNSVTLNELASDVDNTYNKQQIFIRGGVGADQVRTITSYDGSTKIAQIDTSWNFLPDNTASYEMLPGRIETADVISDAIWSEDITGYTDVSTAGNVLWNNVKNTVNKVIPFLFSK